MRDESRTTCDEDANSVQTTDELVLVMVQLRSAAAGSDPKKRDPEAVAKDETDEEISEGLMVPKTATSSIGSEESDWKRRVLLAGGVVLD